MKYSIKIILFLFLCQLSFGQKLVHQNRGNITDDKGNHLSSNDVRSLLANNEKLLEEYNNGRNKKTTGNVLLVGGAILAFGVTGAHLYNGTAVPTGIFAAGVASMLVAIPIKVGFTKKIKQVVTEYNNQKAVGVNNFKMNNLDIVANSNGLGVKLTLN
jgi:hypothetical protein